MILAVCLFDNRLSNRLASRGFFLPHPPLNDGRRSLFSFSKLAGLRTALYPSRVCQALSLNAFLIFPKAATKPK